MATGIAQKSLISISTPKNVIYFVGDTKLVSLSWKLRSRSKVTKQSLAT